MQTNLSQANHLFIHGSYDEALIFYALALEELPEMEQFIQFNMRLSEKRSFRVSHSNKKTLSHAISDSLATQAIVIEKPDDLDTYSFESIKNSGLFDASWYLNKYRNIYEIKGNPLSHYLTFGVQEGLNPSAGFDTLYYLQCNPDVAAADVHPFIHYVSQGYKEARGTPIRPSLPEYSSPYQIAEPEYIPRLPAEIVPAEKAVRVICFYLPQFHPIPENDAWWGNGFTEWSNVRPAIPQFEGHYQPHVPDNHIGYYNLLDRDVQAKQIELAKQYGIEGFCFYLYWFSGKRLLEQPIDNYLNDPSLDLPFCVCWANENWSRRWDGLEDDLLMVQHYSVEDDLNFISNIAKYLRDPRYIRVDGKPLLLIYRPNLFPDMKATSKRWRDWCLANGYGEIYLAYPQSFECVDPEIYGFDAAVEFPPNNSSPPNITAGVKPVVENFRSTVYDWRVFIDRSERYLDPGYKLFRGVCPSWDNTARKKNKGTVFHNSCPKLFTRWLTNAFTDTLTRFDNPDERIVFINAWNEWAEGAHLEPDQRYGYAWLQAVKDAQKSASMRRKYHHDVFQVRWNKLAMLFGAKLDVIQYQFLADYESMLRQANKNSVEFNVQDSKPICKIADKTYLIESRESLKLLTDYLYPRGPICFVVLQYNQSNLTINCVESIKNLDRATQEVFIVIVDNKSEQVHVNALKNKFQSDPQVTLLYSDKNLGFSGGNNIGYQYARDVLNAQFCIVINNDAEIRQPDFIDRTLALFGKESFSLAGPDVRIADGRQENPWNDHIYSIEEFHSLRLMRTDEKENYLAGQSPLFKKIGVASPRAQLLRNALLQGAALIVSPVFMCDHKELFDERLFLYGEEFLLATECLLSGHLTVYDSSLHVHHLEGATTDKLPAQTKLLLGYDSAIFSMGLVLDRLERQRAATRGEAVARGQHAFLQSILRATTRKHILFDLLFCQPGYHGGGEYGKAVFKELIAKYATEGGFELWGAINPKLFIDPWVWDLCKSVGVNLIEVWSYDDIVELVNMDDFYSFFTPAIVVYTGYEYMKEVGTKLPFTSKKTRVIGTLHDIRDFELALDRKRIIQTRKAIGCTREFAMSNVDIVRETATYLDLAEQLRSMYQKIISDEHVDSIITISKYCESSILNNIGQPAKPMKVLMSPMKPRPEPKSFVSDCQHDFSIVNFALLVHAAREEKNAASAVVAFDQIFEQIKLPTELTDLSVVLTGLSSIDQLGLGKIRHKSRFICIPEVPPAQFEFLLSKAKIFIYPSYNEGFGYPPIEAMTYGVTAIVSNTTAIPEICGDAVYYFDPYSIDSISDAIVKGLKYPKINDDLINRSMEIGLKQSDSLFELLKQIVGLE